MRLDKLTTRFQQALAEGQSLALGRDHPSLEPVHIMQALMEDEGGSTGHLLTQAGVDVAQLRLQLDELLDRMPLVEGLSGEIQVSADLRRVLNLTDKFAQKRGDQFISSELFLLAAIEGTHDLARVLTNSGITTERLEKVIKSIRGGHSVNDPNSEERHQALKKYSVDLTKRAEQG